MFTTSMTQYYLRVYGYRKVNALIRPSIILSKR